jgi:hypothetical protein
MTLLTEEPPLRRLKKRLRSAGIGVLPDGVNVPT